MKTTCCHFHATGGPPQDRHGLDPAWVVYVSLWPVRTWATCNDVPAPQIDAVRAALLGVLKDRLLLCVITNRLPTGMTLADWKAEGSILFKATKLGPCPERFRLRCRCGCPDLDHDERDTDLACLNPYCGCTGWRQPSSEREEVTTLSTRASCSDVCTCGGEHHDGAAYYVSAVRTPSRNDAALSTAHGVALLLGPYASHSVALSLVHTGRRLMERVSYREAMEAAVGTLALRAGVEHPVGKLMDLLAEDERRVDDEQTKPRRRRARRTA